MTDTQSGLLTGFWPLVRRDVTLALKNSGAIGTALGFYLIVVAILPLGLGPDLNLLARIAPGVLWIALLLAVLLTLDRIFHADREDGTLEIIATGPLPLELVAAAKALAHWLTSAATQICSTPPIVASWMLISWLASHPKRGPRPS